MLSRLALLAALKGVLATPTPPPAKVEHPGATLMAWVVQHFPKSHHWFEQAHGIAIARGKDGLVPDWSTVHHPRVLARDGAGQRLMPRLPALASGTTLITLDGEPDFWVRTTPIGAQAAAAEVVDGMIVYPGAFGASHLLYKLTPTHVDEYLVVPTAKAPHVLRYRMELGPAVARVRALPEVIELLDGKGAARLRMDRPFARDAAGQRRNGVLEVKDDVVTLRVNLEGLAFPVLVDPDWSTTGRLIKERFEDAALLLPGGEVLAPGGCTLTVCPRGLEMATCSSVLVEVERYNPGSGSWRQAAPMSEPRYAYASARLPDGEVLVAGGCSQPSCTAVTGGSENLRPQPRPLDQRARAAAARLRASRALAGRRRAGGRRLRRDGLLAEGLLALAQHPQVARGRHDGGAARPPHLDAAQRRARAGRGRLRRPRVLERARGRRGLRSRQ